jgi:hypothetical protein
LRTPKRKLDQIWQNLLQKAMAQKVQFCHDYDDNESTREKSFRTI